MNTAVDADRNGILFDPLSSGSFSGSGANAIRVQNKGGRNGAYGPGSHSSISEWAGGCVAGLDERSTSAPISST